MAATKDLPCEFCGLQFDVAEPPRKPAISFSASASESGLRVSSHIVICADHLRRLAEKAEELAPEPWIEEDHQRLAEELKQQRKP